MSGTSNAVKASQLGMPWGTASGRLKKILLFRCLQKLNEDVCFKCTSKIVKVEDLTIEHKKPWLHVDTKLFWDLENIAFSHTWCNRPDRPAGPDGQFSKLRIKCPSGMSWCNRHKKFLPTVQFSKNSSHWSGYHTLCKECQHYTREKVPSDVGIVVERVLAKH